MNTGDRIKQRRLELGLTADDLAQKIGKSRATIYRYENGDIENMPTPILEPLAKALDTTPADLMGWTSTVKLISNEMKRVSDQTNLYIQLFESYGYKITLKADTVDVQTKAGKSYTFDRKDFMSMIQRCYKDITYNMERLIDEYDNGSADNEFDTIAAHHNGDKYTEDELEEIHKFKESVKIKRE